MAILANIRHTLNRKLKRHRCEFDITRDPRFIKSQEAFKDACRELKSVGKAVVKHFPEINPEGKKKLFSSFSIQNIII